MRRITNECFVLGFSRIELAVWKGKSSTNELRHSDKLHEPSTVSILLKSPVMQIIGNLTAEFFVFQVYRHQGKLLHGKISFHLLCIKDRFSSCNYVSCV